MKRGWMGGRGLEGDDDEVLMKCDDEVWRGMMMSADILGTSCDQCRSTVQ